MKKIIIFLGITIAALAAHARSETADSIATSQLGKWTATTGMGAQYTDFSVLLPTC